MLFKCPALEKCQALSFVDRSNEKNIRFVIYGGNMKKALILLFILIFSMIVMNNTLYAKSDDENSKSSEKSEVTQVKDTTNVIHTNDAEPPADNEDDYKYVPHDELPTPIGGAEAYYKNLVYPEIARKAGIEGNVVIYAQISESGDVLRTKVVQSLFPSCDEAAAEAIKSVKWNPAKNQGKPVTVWKAVSVFFRL